MKLKTNGLKTLALTLPNGSALRNILLAEKDELSSQEAITKVDIWLKLSRLEKKEEGR